MIVKIQVHLSIGYQGDHNDILEVEVVDNATEEEKEKAFDCAAREWAWNHIELGYSEVEPPTTAQECDASNVK